MRGIGVSLSEHRFRSETFDEGIRERVSVSRASVWQGMAPPLANVSFDYVFSNAIIFKSKTTAISRSNPERSWTVEREWKQPICALLSFSLHSAVTRSSFKSLMATFLFPAVVVALLTSQHRQTSYDMAANALVVELESREWMFTVKF